jgi:hypothetical protein
MSELLGGNDFCAGRVCCWVMSSWRLCGLLMIPGVTKVTITAWGFPPLLFPHAEKYVGLHTKCSLLLSDFNQNWNVLTNFSKIPKY